VLVVAVLQVTRDRPDQVDPRVGQERRDSEDSLGRRATAGSPEIPEALDSPASLDCLAIVGSPDWLVVPVPRDGGVQRDCRELSARVRLDRLGRQDLSELLESPDSPVKLLLLSLLAWP